MVSGIPSVRQGDPGFGDKFPRLIMYSVMGFGQDENTFRHNASPLRSASYLLARLRNHLIIHNMTLGARLLRLILCLAIMMLFIFTFMDHVS
ncbi:hypothetical protein H2248_000033 [Termitomyces sp. 'cryptogamus']|nr:hypothetical protein H2248_000033 [Termitomyces sp. 'cryptogamus']